MGRNTAIKRYEPLPEGRPLDLFDSAEGRRPVVLDLLSTPWLTRASALVSPEDAGVGRRVCERVEVAWDAEERSPRGFVRDGRFQRVAGVVQTWAVDRRWWEPTAHVSRRCWRVLTEQGGTYDLAFDRVSGTWLLLGILD